MNIRLMTEGDIRRVIPFYMEYYNGLGDNWTEEITYRRIHQVWSREDSLCLLAEEEDAPVAFLMGSFEVFYDLTAYNLAEIVVARKHQKQGIGTLLMGELEQRVLASGGSLIQLSAVNDAFHQHFYGKLNYQTCTNLVLKSKFL